MTTCGRRRPSRTIGIGCWRVTLPGEDVVAQARGRRLLSAEHFTIDGTLREAWAGQKSFRRKDQPGGPPDDPSVRLPTVDAPTGRVLSMTQSLAAQRGSTAGCAEALVDSRSGRGSDVVRPSTHRRYRSAKLGEIVAKRSRFTPLLESTSCGNRPVRRANLKWSIPDTWVTVCPHSRTRRAA